MQDGHLGGNVNFGLRLPVAAMVVRLSSAVGEKPEPQRTELGHGPRTATGEDELRFGAAELLPHLVAQVWGDDIYPVSDDAKGHR